VRIHTLSDAERQQALESGIDAITMMKSLSSNILEKLKKEAETPEQFFVPAFIVAMVNASVPVSVVSERFTTLNLGFLPTALDTAEGIIDAPDSSRLSPVQLAPIVYHDVAPTLCVDEPVTFVPCGKAGYIVPEEMTRPPFMQQVNRALIDARLPNVGNTISDLMRSLDGMKTEPILFSQAARVVINHYPEWYRKLVADLYGTCTSECALALEDYFAALCRIIPYDLGKRLSSAETVKRYEQLVKLHFKKLAKEASTTAIDLARETTLKHNDDEVETVKAIAVSLVGSLPKVISNAPPIKVSFNSMSLRSSNNNAAIPAAIIDKDKERRNKKKT